LIARSIGHRRPTVNVPLNVVRLGLQGVRRVVGEAAFATWEEAELMEVPMITPRGDADVRELGVAPRSLADVLG
jgi:NADH dehydrogenase